MNTIEFVAASHPLHSIGSSLHDAVVRAQKSAFSRVFVTTDEYLKAVSEQLRLAIDFPPEAQSLSPTEFAEKSFGEFCRFFAGVLEKQNYPSQSVPRTAASLAARAMLLRAFENPDAAVTFVRDKVVEVVKTFPRTAADIEVGRNKGDVLDPFILAATQYLLYKGEFDGAVTATVSHKALMIIEGLLGHLHEDVLGLMRGNVRVPEPRGEDQEAFHLTMNPFPGADLVQPPTRQGEHLRIHQIKSKTGSAKGGDGKRLGDQLSFLAKHYDAEIFYDALVGNTLVGHRSKKGVEKAAPNVQVLVGQSAFAQLTGSRHGAALLLRLYQESFQSAAAATGYSIEDATVGIVEYFRERSASAGEGFLESILQKSTGGFVREQSSVFYNQKKC